MAIQAMSFLLTMFITCCLANYQDGRCLDQYGSDLTKNFALSGTASQSSTFNNGQASRLIDGNNNPYFGNNSCSETDVGDDVFWQVDLPNAIYVTSVTITTRADPYWMYSDYFEVKTPTKLCTSGFLSNNGETKTLACARGRSVSLVILVLPGTAKRLSLCEFQVHGRELGFHEREVNYALRQPAKQSSMYSSAVLYMASLGVDGNKDPDLENGLSCTHTDDDGGVTSQWWKVDLGKNTVVYAVTLTNRNFAAWRLYDFEIFISPSVDVVEEKSQTCDGRRGVAKSVTKTIFCKQPIKGRYLAVVTRKTEALTICELSVQGREEECVAPRPLGMESFRILDSQISASSVREERYSPRNARLNFEQGRDGRTAAWIRHVSDGNPWLQVDFLWIVTVTEIRTQGREIGIHAWVKSYFASYGGWSGVDFQFYTENGVKKMFTGNSDAPTIARNVLSPTIVARFVRIHPNEFHWLPGLRIEFVGCYSGDEGYRSAMPLGMENGQITESQLKVSSFHSNGWEKGHGRLNLRTGKGAWILGWDLDKWFQVDFILITTVVEIKTQGASNDQYWVKTYKVHFGYESQYFQAYGENGATKVFAANVDQNSVVSNTLSPAIVARFIRIYPLEKKSYEAMRMEFIGFYKECSNFQPLGLEDRRILDSQITGSTTYGGIWSPHSARLNNGGDNTWVPLVNDNQWLQVDFNRLVKVTQIHTQGRNGVSQWLKSYSLSYGRDGQTFYDYAYRGTTKIFTGNKDDNSVVHRDIEPAIVAQYVRVNPVSWQNHIALRLEFVGCYLGYADSCQNIPGRKPLGMESFKITNAQLNASSEYRSTLGTSAARLNFFTSDIYGGSWCTLNSVDVSWFQVDFLRTVKVIGLATQGRYHLDEWLLEYALSYKEGNDGDGIDFQIYKQQGKVKIFTANTDRNGIVRNYVDPYINARLLRINPKSWSLSICTRVEFYGYEVDLLDGEYADVENRISASSWLDHRHKPSAGIISAKPDSTSWTPSVEKTEEFIQVDLVQLTALAGVELRRAADFPHDSYTQLMLYHSATEGEWKLLKDRYGQTMKLLTSDCYREFDYRVLARHVRLTITSWGRRTSFRFQLHEVTAYDRTAAGVEDGIIKDDQLKSSNHPDDPHPAREGRLNFPGAWCGNTMRKQLFLQVDFLVNFQVHALTTQGKFIDVMEYVTQFKLSSTLDDIHWTSYKAENGIAQLFPGNKNCRCSHKNFVKPFLAQSLRVLPTTWVGRPCLRIEVFGVYKGILKVHVRSGPVFNKEGALVTRQSAIKLNGKGVIDTGDGYNVVVANYITGDLMTSNSSLNISQLTEVLKSIADHSIVIIATQNVKELLPDETLPLLEPLGAVRLRYSLTSDHDSWVLVGYKGTQRVNWITERIGKVGETVRVAVFVPLNKRGLEPKYREYFQSPVSEISKSNMSLEGHHTQLLHSANSRCGVNNTACQEKLSLAMWMKYDMPKYSKETTSSSMSGRFVFKYYSNGYNFIVPKHTSVWNDARSYCLAIQADLLVIPDEHTWNFVKNFYSREDMASSSIHIGLTRHPDNLHIFRWVDGSTLVFSRWKDGEPNSLGEPCATSTESGYWNDIACENVHQYRFICQRPIEDITGLQPLGMENDVIPDDSITASTWYNQNHAPHLARPNTQRYGSRGWCRGSSSDQEPHLQVDLGEIKTVCGIGTMGRGDYVADNAFPTSYSVQLSNDSLHWTLLQEGGNKKVFNANEDRYSMVINRFHRAFLAQFVKVNILTWNPAGSPCARLEIFSCKIDKERIKSPKPSYDVEVPLSIKENIPQDCLGVLMSGKNVDGVYMINPGYEGAFPVYCDQTTDGGGWTVFQSRVDGAVDFYRTGDEYDAGFGDVNGEHWIGNEKLLRITNAIAGDLRIDLKSFSGDTSYIKYFQFKLASGKGKYALSFSSTDNGPAGDAFSQLKNKEFSTKNSGNEMGEAAFRHGGWWYTTGVLSNLNGKYYSTSQWLVSNIFWHTWKDYNNLKTTKMMMRRTEIGGSSGALGIESYSLKWQQISTDNPAEVPAHRVYEAKLNKPTYWKVDPGHYFEINFNVFLRVTHFASQGGSDFNYVKKFFVRLKDASGFWKDYEENGELKIFEGNNDRTKQNEFDTVSNCLYDTGRVSHIRVHLHECSSKCSLRIEFYSCEDSCSSPLGVSSNLPDDRLTASSSKYGHPPQNGRLFKNAVWSPEVSKQDEFLQVNFLEMFKVTYVATRGYAVGGLPCFVKSYAVMYKNKDRNWIMYRKGGERIFRGNINPYVAIRNKIEEPFLAQALRFVVKTWQTNICLRTEIYGCYPDNPKFIVHTDSAPAGKDFRIKGKYRYCEDCECPGCKKSICLRVFDKVHTLAARFKYDCLYHDFDIPVQASVVPGVHKVWISESDYSDCSNLSDERMLGTMAVTEASSCLDLLLSGHTKSGQYSIEPDKNGPITVYCDQETFGGGWTLLQRRVDGSVNFTRNWAAYKQGFGDLERNFWLGNDFIHRLTSTKRELLLDVNSENGDHAHVLYKSFQVASEDDEYKLHVSEYQESVANCFVSGSGNNFSTYDRDNDKKPNDHCAVMKGSGWWFGSCGPCYLNGVYGNTTQIQKMKFNTWQDNSFLNGVEMKIRSRDVVTCNDEFCYYVLKISRHWSTAREECRRFHSDLVSIHNAIENDWLANEILREQNIDQVHLGMRNATTWTDGSKVSFQNFSSSFSSDGCPALRKDGSWEIQNCNRTRTVLCKRGKFCFKGKCYLYHAGELENAAAQKYCRDLGYDLAKVSSEREHKYLAEFVHASIKNSLNADVWLGLKRDDSPEFSWADGTEIDFAPWKAGEPDEEAKLCATRTQTLTWKDTHCGERFAFPCEKIIDPDYVKPKDCLELLLSGTSRSGVYIIDPDGMGSFSVYCDQDTMGGGWTVLTRRVDGGESFHRTWDEYKSGFGSLNRNFWLGNDFIHRMTASNREVLFDFESESGDNSVVLYKTFKVGGESEKYKLTIGEFEPGDRGDAMGEFNGAFFTTTDRDNDKHSGNCADIANGGWWHNACGEAFLTGTYGASDSNFKIRWGGWYLTGAEMKIRRKSIVDCPNKYCFYWSKKKKSWLDALDECRNLNADLVSVRGQDFNDMLADMVSARSLDELYLGLGMGDIERWTSGTAFGYSRLTGSLPASSCVTFKQNGDWAIVDCEEPKSFACQRAIYCYKGDCYFFPESTRNHDSADEFCKERGYNLPKISSREEHQYAFKVMRIKTSDSSIPTPFTSLKLVGSDYQWADGTKLQYNQWNSNEPTGNGEYVTIITPDGLTDVPDSFTRATLCEKVPIAKSCGDVSAKFGRSESSYYSINTGNPKLISVYCDLHSADGPWTVIQRRIYNTAPLDYATKSWENYKKGFGDSESNFWLGNENIHQLTKTPHKLKITIHTVDFKVYEALYEDFTVGDEDSKFVLNFGAYSGTAGDSLSLHRGMKFTTVDQDNDLVQGNACTPWHPGGWWFANCLDSNLNGPFDTKTNGLNTLYWKTVSKPIIRTEMKIQSYPKGSELLPHGLIQNEASLLSFTYDDHTMDVNMQTSNQHWAAKIPNPGPFATHVAITWQDNSYLRYYENGTLLAEIAAKDDPRLTYPNTSNLQYAWLNELSLFNKQLTNVDVEMQYQQKTFAFEEDDQLWNFKNSSKYSWDIIRNCTPSVSTGPCGDHTYLRNFGSFAYAEASLPAAYGDQTFIQSPNLLGIYRCLSFWYHIFGVELGSLKVYLITNSSTIDVSVKNISGNHGNYWRYMEIDMNIDTVFKIVFAAVRGNHFQSDVAIDDVTLSPEKCKNECNPPCGPDERCDHSTLLCFYEGIYDHRWTLNSLNITENTTLSITGAVEETKRFTEGAMELKGNGKITFREFSSICKDTWCFPMYTVSFWLKYEEVQSQTILSFGDLLKVTQNAGTPKDHVSIEVKSSTKKCFKNFFVPTEVWSHIIVAVHHDFTVLYLDGRTFSNSSDFQCTAQNGGQSQFHLTAGGSGAVNFALDDVRVLLDVQSTLDDTVRSYKETTGHNQTIFVRAKLTSQAWNDDLLHDESDAYQTLSKLINNKVLETLKDRSNISKVVVEKFSPGSVIADLNFIYNDVYYEDILLVEEALLVNNTFNGLDVESIVINSTSVPNFRPSIISARSPNTTALWLNWTEVGSFYMNGIFQGYKVLYRETKNSTYSRYSVKVVYGNKTEALVTGLQMLTNYTLRVLAFTLSGDGLLSDSLTALTLNGEVIDSLNITLKNISSTALYANWTILPNSTSDYRRLLGYHVVFWKQSNRSSAVEVKAFKNYILAENLEKWTEYCFNVSGYNSRGIGPTETKCSRTLEDVPSISPNASWYNTSSTSLKVKFDKISTPLRNGILLGYRLYLWKQSEGNSSEVNATVPPANSVEWLKNLEKWTYYCGQVVGFTTIGEGPRSPVECVRTFEDVPSAAPDDVSLLNVSSTALDLNWTALSKPSHNGALLGYRIFIWKSSEGNESSHNTTVSSTTLFKQFKNLSKWTTYCVQLTAFTSIGDGPRSKVECSRTHEDAPEEPPRNFIAVNISVSSIELQWSPPRSHATPGIIRQYNMTYRNLNYTDEQRTELNFDSTVTSQILENLRGLTMYEINITSLTILFGPWDSILVLTEEGVPSISPNVSWYNISSTSLKVEYQHIPGMLCNGILLGYRFYLWKQSEGKSSELNTTVPPAESVKLFENLEKWTHYCGQVAGFTRIGEGPRSPVECIRTFEDAPEIAPSNLNTSNITWTSFYLTWEPIDASFIPGILRSYRITYKILDPGFNRFNGTYDGSLLVDSLTSAVNVTGLIGLTNYEVMVNGVTVSDGPGNVTSLQTVEGIPTEPPDDITPTDITATTISLAWKQIFLPERHGIVRGFQLTYRKSENTRSKRDVEKTLTFDADVFSAFVFKLTPYNNYTLTLAGFTSEGMGEKKIMRIETLQAAPKAEPKDLYGVNFTGPETIFVGWGSLSREELQGLLVGYEVRYRMFSVADEVLVDPPPEVVRIIYSDINGIKINGLETYTTYQVSVAALSGGGTGVSTGTLYIATCRCHKILTTNYWNLQPYTNISRDSSNWGLYPHLLDMVTLSCCQSCLEHGLSEIDYFQDGVGNPSGKKSDIDVKRNVTLETDFSFPVYGFEGQTQYSKYYGFAAIVEIVGTVFFTKKPDYSLTQGNAMLASVMSIVPFLAIAVIFACIAGIIMWALECGANEEEYPSTFFRGAASGFWWAYITMTTVGYGDKTARTLAGRLFAIVWVLVGLVISSLLIGTISSAFTSSTAVPEVSTKTLYGATVAALHDSPDHKLGVRRNAKVNTLKEYWSLKELREDLLSEKVDGILVDTYVADARRDLFSDSQILVKQVIDLRSSYGVVMGENATKLRKCFNGFWSENKVTRNEFIGKNIQPLAVTVVTTEEIASETFNPQGVMYAMTLNICLILLCLGAVCGCLYEFMRRRKKKAKVEPEAVSLPSSEYLKQEMSEHLDTVKDNIKKLLAKHEHAIRRLAKIKQKGM